MALAGAFTQAGLQLNGPLTAPKVVVNSLVPFEMLYPQKQVQSMTVPAGGQTVQSIVIPGLLGTAVAVAVQVSGTASPGRVSAVESAPGEFVLQLDCEATDPNQREYTVIILQL